jgi:predicted ATPase
MVILTIMPELNDSNPEESPVMPLAPKRIIITGAPGTGKTTLINALRAQGLACIAEPAREIIAEQRAIDGDGVWERDTRLFLELLLSRSIGQFKAAETTTEASSGPIFYDRGIPDCLAYAATAGMELPHFERAAHEYRYEAEVWLLPPWEEIYTQDSERRMSFAATYYFHESLVAGYEHVGYKVREVPRGTVAERAISVIGD